MNASAGIRSPDFRFGYGALALDLGVTLRRRPSERIELLLTPADAARWLVQAGLAGEALRLSDGDLDELRSLREAVYRTGQAATRSAAPAPADVRTLNAAARSGDVAPQLSEDWSVRAPRAKAFQSALASLARDAIALFADEKRRSRLRTCEQSDCGGLFLDRSRGERRRWCSMARCGNRAKAAAFRDRRKGEHT